jgi:hypothetical protein
MYGLIEHLTITYGLIEHLTIMYGLIEHLYGLIGHINHHKRSLIEQHQSSQSVLLVLNR